MKQKISKTEELYTHEIKCGFCGVKTGEVQVPLSKIEPGTTPTNADFGIDDSRCSDCQSEHGKFIKEPEPEVCPVIPEEETEQATEKKSKKK